VRALDSCFAKSKLGVMGSIRMDLISMPINPWNESKWWAALARLPGVFKGAHPIRYDKRCMTLSLELAMARIDAWWDRTLDAGLGQLAVHGPGVRPYSYFTNTLWMASVEHYAAALDRADLFVDGFDEVPLNLYTIQEQHGALCTLPGSLIVHPAYNSVEDKPERIREAVRRLNTFIEIRDRRPPRVTMAGTASSFHVAVVAVCASPNQNYYFWPTYLALPAGVTHDLIVVHRNRAYVTKENLERARNVAARIILVDKSTTGPGGSEVPARGFGAYRHAFELYGANYDIFCFVMDQTSVRRVNWLKAVVDSIAAHDALGFAAAHIFNGNDLGVDSTGYPHESHCRAPGPIAARTAILKKLDWHAGFTDDHGGEMWFCKALAATGTVGVQVGNKLNLAYDNVGVPPLAPGATSRTNYHHITELLETKYFPALRGTLPFNATNVNFFERLWTDASPAERKAETVPSPHRHLGTLSVFKDLQPFNSLVYGPTLAAARAAFGDLVVTLGNAHVLDLAQAWPADRRLDPKSIVTTNVPMCKAWDCVLAAVRGKTAIEVGGPSGQFGPGRRFALYGDLDRVDNINLYSLTDSFQTIKQSPLNRVFSEMFTTLADVPRRYELLVTSHAIEHFANPLKILADFSSKLVPHGLILSFVPNHEAFWDRTRNLTTPAHLENDLAGGTREDDLMHLGENLATAHPYKSQPHHPDMAPGLTYADMLAANIEYRIMHHHTFDLDLVVATHERLGFETIAAFCPEHDELQLIYLGRSAF